MVEKSTHFGRAGEFFAMSELLLRGWNVAVPVVDVGDDVFVIDDNEKTTYRLQVKTASATPQSGGSQAGQFKLSRAQLATVLPVELFYMLLARMDTQWRFLVIPRSELWALRQRFEGAPRSTAGRPPVSDSEAKTDSIAMNVIFERNDASCWGESLARYLATWPDELAPIEIGPGARKR